MKLGKNDLLIQHERGSEVKYLNDIIIHNKWQPLSKDYDSDIALLIFDTKVRFSNKISPICLWNQDAEPKAKRGTVVGWGVSDSGRYDEKLPRELEIFIRLKEKCFANNPRFAPISSAKTFCAGRDSQAGPCSGDSGSGMFQRAESGVYFLRGLVSAGFVDNGTCEDSADVIYTDVLKHQHWINDELLKNGLIIPEMPLPSDNSDRASGKLNKEVYCFFESWADGRRDDGAFTFGHIKPELCTILVFLHADMEDDNLKSINEWQQTAYNGEKLYKVFNGLKRKHRHLKTLLSVGSWNEGSVKYSMLAADPARRKRFAEKSAAFLEQYEFDGLHFHWESPGHRGGGGEDKQNFVLLLKDIKDFYKQRNLFLSSMVRVQSKYVTRGYDLKGISDNVDAVLMFTFDLAGYWDKEIGFSAPLHGEGENTVESRVNFFISQGVPAEKIILGIPFFGRTFVTRSEGKIGDPSQGAFYGPFYQENGFLGYNEFCFMKKTNEMETKFDEVASQAISTFKKEGMTHVVTYDTPRSVANKVKFVTDKNLGGVWTWFMSSDDFRGECEIDTTAFADFPAFDDSNNVENKPRQFPLLRTINEALARLSSK